MSVQSNLPGSRAPIAKDCVDCRSGDCGFRIHDFAFSPLRTPSILAFVGRFRISTNSATGRIFRELRGP
eukprot:2588293-Alexandrium_andersonii.AAC.1